MKMSQMFPALAALTASYAQDYGHLEGCIYGRKPTPEELERLLAAQTDFDLDGLMKANQFFDWASNTSDLSHKSLQDMEDWVYDEDYDPEYADENPGCGPVDRRIGVLTRRSPAQAPYIAEAHVRFGEEGIHSAAAFLHNLYHGFVDVEGILDLVPPVHHARKVMRANVIYRIDTSTDGELQKRLEGRHLEWESVHSWSRGNRVLTITKGENWSMTYTIDGVPSGILYPATKLGRSTTRKEIETVTQNLIGWGQCALGQ